MSDTQVASVMNQRRTPELVKPIARIMADLTATFTHSPEQAHGKSSNTDDGSAVHF